MEVLGWAHRRGSLHLLLVLPDGTRSLIPAAWTDLHDGPNAPRANRHAATLASLVQLLRARTIVDALLRRLGASDREAPQPQAEGRERAATAELPEDADTSRRGSCMGRTGRGPTGRGRGDAGPPDREDGRPKQGRRDRGPGEPR